MMRQLRYIWFILTRGRAPICWIILEEDNSDWDCKNYWLSLESEIYGEGFYSTYCRGRSGDMETMGKMAEDIFPSHQYILKKWSGIVITDWQLSIEEMEKKYFGY
tara:strand:+ start:297 stop:611 length:315 start_codon:yes stop_codon:yes gene_type:complete